MPERAQARCYLLVIATSATCWLLGIWLPMLEFHPYPSFVRFGIEPYRKSTLETVIMLFEKRYLFAACMLVLCSVVIPVIKLVGLTLVTAAHLGWIRTKTTWPEDVTRLIASISSYQFVDVFVGLLFVAFCNTPEVDMVLLAGFYIFLAYCILSSTLVYIMQEEDRLLESMLLKVERRTVVTNWSALVFLLCLGCGEPMLDVAYTFHGIAVGRSRMGLSGMVGQLVVYGDVFLGVLFIFHVVLAPLILGAVYLVSTDCLGVMGQRRAKNITSVLEKCTMTDVFSLALVIFLFSLQSDNVHSAVPSGTFFGLFYTEWLSGFYVALGYGAATFTLRWRALSQEQSADNIMAYYDIPSSTFSLYNSVSSPSHAMGIGDLPGDTGEALYPVRQKAAAPRGQRVKEMQGITQSLTEEGADWGNRGGATPPTADRASSPSNSPRHRAHGPEPTDDTPHNPPKGQQKDSKLRRLMRNPVFHIKVTSWIIWGICYFGIDGPPKLSFMSVNKAVNDILPLVNSAINMTVPTSFGNCTSPAVPTPCVGGDQPLYDKQSGGTAVTVRWATGLNTIALDDISIQIIPDSTRPIQMQIKGKLEAVRMSILIQNCILGCQTVWDNDDGCCGKNRSFDLVIATECVDDRGSFSSAGLGDFKVEWFSIEPMVIKEKFLGIDVQMTDITPAVESSVRRFLEEYLSDKKTIAINDDHPLTFSQIVRRVWEYNVNERRFSCQQLYGRK